MISLVVKYKGQTINLNNLEPDKTVEDIKLELQRITNILPENQKLIGLKSITNSMPNDSDKISTIIIKENTKIMLIGSSQDDIVKVNAVTENSNTIDDFEMKEEDVPLCNLSENIEKVERRSKSYRPRKLAPFRDGKRLLVLDIDYTIFDHLTPAESVQQLARPYLMEFLTRVYVHYDIAFWSATSMTWILAKLSQLGVIPINVVKVIQHQPAPWDKLLENHESCQLANDAPFRVALILDATDMISVNLPGHGVKEVKPLAVLWNNHPQWGPENTVMIDDVRRNFVMNPDSGLRIRSYRDAHMNFEHDCELINLAHYLELIAQLELDFTKLVDHHHHWERYLMKHTSVISDIPASTNTTATKTNSTAAASTTCISKNCNVNNDDDNKTDGVGNSGSSDSVRAEDKPDVQNSSKSIEIGQKRTHENDDRTDADNLKLKFDSSDIRSDQC